MVNLGIVTKQACDTSDSSRPPRPPNITPARVDDPTLRPAQGQGQCGSSSEMFRLSLKLFFWQPRECFPQASDEGQIDQQWLLQSDPRRGFDLGDVHHAPASLLTTNISTITIGQLCHSYSPFFQLHEPCMLDPRIS